MRRKLNRILIVLLLVCLVSAPFASAQYTDSITVLGGLGAISRDALEEMLDLVACKCTGGGGCECGGGGGVCACECACEICTFLKSHPVGSIYMSTAPGNPEDIYGGEWEAWGQGRVPVGVGAVTEYNTAGDTSFKPLPYLTAGEMGGSLGSTGNASVTLSDMSVTGSIPVSGNVALNSGSVTISGTGRVSGILGISAAYSHTLSRANLPNVTGWFSSNTGGQGKSEFIADGTTFVVGGGGGSYPNPAGTNSGPHDVTFYLNPNAQTNVTGNATQTLTLATTGAIGTDNNNLGVNGSQFAGTLSDLTTTHSLSGSSENLEVSGNGTATITDSTLQPYVTCYMWRRTAEGTSLCTKGGCNCGGGGSGTGGNCDCEPYTATLPISITDNDISIDLSGYVTTGGLTTALGSYVTSTSLATTLAGYVTATGLTTALGSYYTKTEIDGKGYLTDVTASGTGNPITATKTGSEVDLAFGTLGVGKGGTGAATLGSGEALIGNGAGTVTTRAITNITAPPTEPNQFPASGQGNYLVTANTLKAYLPDYNAPYTGAAGVGVEIDTGVNWVNGKRIYRRTQYITSTVGSAAWTTAMAVPAGLTQIIEARWVGSASNGTAGVYTTYPFVQVSGANVQVYSNGYQLYGSATYPSWFTIWYTK